MLALLPEMSVLILRYQVFRALYIHRIRNFVLALTPTDEYPQVLLEHNASFELRSLGESSQL